MSLDPVMLVKRYHEALNAYDEKTVAPMFSPGATYVSPGVSGTLAGRDAIITAFSAYFAEHPDQLAVDEAIEQIAPFTARSSWRLQATKASTGEKIVRRGIEIITFENSGLILHVEVKDR